MSEGDAYFSDAIIVVCQAYIYITMSAIILPHPETLGGKLQRIPGYVSVLLPGMEARIIRDDGTEADVNEPGELWLRRNSIALGYWNDPKASLETFVDGWLHIGDRFRLDEEEYFLVRINVQDIEKHFFRIIGLLIVPRLVQSFSNPGFHNDC